MKTTILFSLLALSISSVVCAKPKPFSPPVVNQTSVFSVSRIVDGDTFEIEGPEHVLTTVRLLGVDCPESHVNSKCKREGLDGGESCQIQIPKGLSATRFAQDNFLGKKVLLENVKVRTDLYGRTLAYVRVFSTSQDVGLEMIKSGHCHNFSRYPHPRKNEYIAAESK